MTLTEKWKKGELENDWYYIRTTNGIEKWEYIKQSYGFGYYETEWVLEVLAPVPSYEEWQTVFNYATKYEVEYVKCVNDYEELKNKNQQLRALLKECKPLFFPFGKGFPISGKKQKELLTRINAAIGESEE